MDNRLPGLDALRGWAALSVLVAHTVLVNEPPATRAMIAAADHLTLAVPLFFALSAFSLAYGYDRRLFSWDEIRSYALRRFLRIAPLFYVMAIAWLIFSAHWPSSVAVFLNATFLFGFSRKHFGSFVPAGWSIGVEMIFYTFLPIVLLFIRDQRRAIVGVIVALLVGYVVHQVMLPQTDERMAVWFARMNFITNAANFMGGIWAYFLYRQVAHCDEVRRRRLSTALIGVALGIWASTCLLSEFLGELERSYPRRYLISAAFPVLIVALALVPWRLLVNRATVWVGAVSYSIYLTHVLVIEAILPIRKKLHSILPDKVHLTMAISVAVIAGVTLAVSAVTFALIERPAMRLARTKLSDAGAPLLEKAALSR